ncbi:hypothetical protein BN1723_020670 [Verticillium longisporum]|uniref:Uncharacterized protein n=1 Tax=Verticillium longisporum TaxID=100787 RepID=A0A0G4NR15_VERLO|nr:hypothetical protein BN1723_020670 [Verticillium longisporum]
MATRATPRRSSRRLRHRPNQSAASARSRMTPCPKAASHGT